MEHEQDIVPAQSGFDLYPIAMTTVIRPNIAPILSYLLTYFQPIFPDVMVTYNARKTDDFNSITTFFLVLASNPSPNGKLSASMRDFITNHDQPLWERWSCHTVSQK